MNNKSNTLKDMIRKHFKECAIEFEEVRYESWVLVTEQMIFENESAHIMCGHENFCNAFIPRYMITILDEIESDEIIKKNGDSPSLVNSGDSSSLDNFIVAIVNKYYDWPSYLNQEKVQIIEDFLAFIYRDIYYKGLLDACARCV